MSEMGEPMTAWAAGLFEGEGCITTPKRSPQCLHLTVVSTDRDVLERFLSVVGGGSIGLRSMPASKPHWKQSWAWQVAGEDAARILSLLLPYLCTRRTSRALKALEQRTSHIEEVTKERVCPICQRSFRPPYHGQSRRTVNCSRECYKRANCLAQIARQNNSAAYRAYQRAYYAAHRDEVTAKRRAAYTLAKTGGDAL